MLIYPNDPNFEAFLLGKDISVKFDKFHSFYEIQPMECNHRKWEIIQIDVYYTRSNILLDKPPEQYNHWKPIATNFKSRKEANIYLDLLK